MAQKILALLVKRIVDKLSSLIGRSSSEEPPTASEQELLKLERTMARIHALLDDAEKSGKCELSNQDKLFLSELKEVAYEAEDAVDEYEYQVLCENAEARKQKKEVSLSNLSINSAKVCCISEQLACRVENIMKKYEEIRKDWESLRLTESDGKQLTVEKWVSMETTSLIDQVTIGREDEKEDIIKRLLGGNQTDEKGQISILPIVGMGGIGKTTVAQMVYNDKRVESSFDLRGWIYVSENFDTKHLMQKIMASFRIDFDYNMSLDMLCQTIKENLKGKRFFLVLDDVWNEDHELWSPLKKILLHVGTGKIIVTTRNEYVAEIMETTPYYQLHELSFNHSWSLFMKLAFENRDPNLYPVNLLSIGRQITEKCQGLPLAVRVLASIVRFEKRESVWRDILDNELWLLKEEKNKIIRVLKLSYDRMPIELRPCFMYLSLFPKGSPLERAPIVKQWMSHGFLRPRGGKEEEDIGNACFNELLQRSILQYDNVRTTDTFIMHDLIHDLAQSVASDDYLLITAPKVPHIPKTIHHISVYVREDLEIISWWDEVKRLWPKLKSLRTLMLHGVYNSSPPITHLLANLTCLRTLVLEEGIDLSDVIGNLKHLRYLHVPDVPNSVYKLYHLHTLNSENEIELTSEIGDLINLRHLRGYDADSLPREIGGLTKLQTLEEFSLGVESWQCKVGHLEGLDNLRGSLAVRGLGTVTWPHLNSCLARKSRIENLKQDWGTSSDHDNDDDDDDDDDDDAKLADISTHLFGSFKGGTAHAATHSNGCLVRKSKIENLKLDWGTSDDDDDDEKLAEHVLDCFRPHGNVRQLVIEGYDGGTFPVWLGDTSFSKLEQLELRYCDKCTSLPTLGHLPALKRLEIVGMDKVTVVGREFACSSELVPVAIKFPALVFLKFESMSEWEVWNGVEAYDLPHLRQLELRDCPKLKALPSLSSLTELTLKEEFHRNFLFSSSLPNLESLHINDFPDASLKLPKPESLLSLGSLSIENCTRLRSIAGLGDMASLQHLAINSCRKLRMSTSQLQPLKLLSLTATISDSPEVAKWYDEALWSARNQLRLEGKNEDTSMIRSSCQPHQTSRNNMALPFKMDDNSGTEEHQGLGRRVKRRN